MSGQQNYRTPPWLFKHLEKVLLNGRKFKLDAFADKENALCEVYYTGIDPEAKEGLSHRCCGFNAAWSWGETFANPEFLEAGKCLDKALYEARCCRMVESVLILPVACSQEWFQRALRDPDQRTSIGVLFPDYRIPFYEPDGTWPINKDHFEKTKEEKLQSGTRDTSVLWIRPRNPVEIKPRPPIWFASLPIKELVLAEKKKYEKGMK